MKYDIIKLHFNSPLHLSRGQTDYYDKSETVLHSDTIKSAIFSCAKVIYKDAVDEDFLTSFIISSAFPFVEGEYFFPKPLLDFNPVIKDFAPGPKTHKKLKRIEYLSKDIFEKFINGKLSLINEKQISDNEKYLFSKPENKKQIFKTEVQQRLVMPKGDEKHPKPFYLDRIYFEESAGLYFIIEFNDESIKQKVINSFKLLETQGLGTDRNIGNGHFAFTEEEIELDTPAQSQLVSNLSLYLPTKDEVINSFTVDSRYKLIKRGGYISNPENEDFLTFRKKSIFMLKEGSVFTNIEQKGKVEDLKPDNVAIHPIYRDGTSLFIPINPKIK